jgi:hypothetical protein
MGFRLLAEADRWFDNFSSTHGAIESKMDRYYLCAIVGMIHNQYKTDVSSPDFIDYFITDYEDVRFKIIGLMIAAELRRLGIDVKERPEVQRQLGILLSGASRTGLSQAGEDALNRYAAGGFEWILEQFSKPPASEDSFFNHYWHSLISTSSE